MTLPSDVLGIAADEIGYLEKASADQLDSKTANAGSGNYTRYWRDLRMDGYQGQPWCDAFVKWCFMRAADGVDAGKELACQSGREWSFYTPTSASYYKAAGRYFAVPQVGDQVFFKDSGGTICHTGLVCAVTSGSIVTIEGNTSGASGVIANGGGVCKKSYVRSYVRIAGYGRPRYEEVPDVTSEQAKQLRRIYDEVTRTDDPTGRKKRLNDHDHLKWVAKATTETQEQVGDLSMRVTRIEKKLETIIGILEEAK